MARMSFPSHRMGLPKWSLLIVVLTLVLAPDAAAQQQASHARATGESHTLVIRDGTVWLDGEAVPSDELPPGLDLRGVQMYEQIGSRGGVTFDVRGQTLALRDGRLVRVEEPSQQAEVSVYFRVQGETVPADEAVRRVSPQSTASVASGTAYAGSAVAADMLRQSQALEAQVLELAEEDVQRLRREQLERQVQLLQRQAASMVETANRLTQAEVQAYFDALQQRDTDLFQQIQREWSLEASTVQIANEIRRTNDSSRRARLSEELRARLDHMFELKQENRRREIDQLERELEALQERLAQRERLRDEIVRRRMEELTGDDGQ